MRLREEQLNTLAKARAQALREAELQAFRERGIKADLDRKSGEVLLKDAAGGTAKITPQPDGVTLTSGEGRITRFEYDEQQRLTALTDPAGLRVSFEHDEKGRLVAIHRGRLSTHHFIPSSLCSEPPGPPCDQAANSGRHGADGTANHDVRDEVSRSHWVSGQGCFGALLGCGGNHAT
ncbi:hypothetical protein MYX78_13755 [Acidobacteria bacterium AH-259-G07]|nr:hypothetical protein [Acidobacteria bacterium AH-259-G07]